MNPGLEAPKPEIVVYSIKGSVPKDVVTEVILGIEEEGLPYKHEDKTDKISAARL